jgi:hypothetical protein
MPRRRLLTFRHLGVEERWRILGPDSPSIPTSEPTFLLRLDEPWRAAGCAARGEYHPLAPPEEAQNFPYKPIDLERTKAEEVIITTMLYDHAARRHSYALLAEAFGLAKRSA